MTDATAFAVRLIETIAPDEVDAVPALIDAYLQGGKARKALFESSSNIPGAFSSVDVVLLTPYLLQAILHAGKLIVNLLSSDIVGDSIAAIKTALELVSAGHTAHEFFSSPKSPSVSQVNIVTNTMSAAVEGAGLSKDQCDEIALRMLQILLENSSETRALVEVVVESKK